MALHCGAMERATTESFRAAVRSHTESLANFIAASPTSYHAAAEVARQLSEAGFSCQEETAPWSGEPGGHFLVRGGAVMAWWIPSGPVAGFKIVGSHTDSPSFKLKPAGKSAHHGFEQVDVEIYGGPLLNSWLNRDLGLAGRVTDMDCGEHLVQTGPCMVIPQLAPHLDRSKELSLDPQRHLHPIFTRPRASADVLEAGAVGSGLETGSDGDAGGSEAGAAGGFQAGPASGDECSCGECGCTSGQANLDADFDLFETLAAGSDGAVQASEIGWHDVYAYCTEKPSVNGCFLAAGRQDNLVSVHASLLALLAFAEAVNADAELEASIDYAPVMAAFDHEEVGSETTSGAAGPILETTLRRIAGAAGKDADEYERMLAASVCVSSDTGHSINPNYAEKYDPDDFPVAGGGPIIKFNSQQRYASDARSVTEVIRAAMDAGVPYQNFVSNNSVPCGTTIGPITATRLGISTVDIGIPLLSMHSARELSHVRDNYLLERLLEGVWLGQFADAEAESH